MTAPAFWVVDPATGDHSLVADDAARDALLGEDWTVVDQPADDAIVTIWREGIDEPGRVPAAALRDLWGPRGWVAGPPAGGAHPAVPKPAVEPSAPEPAEPKAKKTEQPGSLPAQSGR